MKLRCLINKKKMIFWTNEDDLDIIFFTNIRKCFCVHSFIEDENFVDTVSLYFYSQPTQYQFSSSKPITLPDIYLRPFKHSSIILLTCRHTVSPYKIATVPINCMGCSNMGCGCVSMSHLVVGVNLPR